MSFKAGTLLFMHCTANVELSLSTVNNILRIILDARTGFFNSNKYVNPAALLRNKFINVTILKYLSHPVKCALPLQRQLHYFEGFH